MASRRPSSLRERLARIRSTRDSPAPHKAAAAKLEKTNITEKSPQSPSPSLEGFTPGWVEIAPLVARRTISLEHTHPFCGANVGKSLSRNLYAWAFRKQRISTQGPMEKETQAAKQTVPLSSLIFFDLETTGLSSGAGTLAFMAAFGRFTLGAEGADPLITIQQYLLMDYAGEEAFLLAVKEELSGKESKGDELIVSFNGISYDSQLLRTRFVMNAIAPPIYRELDLLYPARRIYRGILPSCALCELERRVLGIEREDDLPGALAPQAWFDYIKKGESLAVQRVAEHNAQDLVGLAALLKHVDAALDDPWPLVHSLPQTACGLSRIFFELEGGASIGGALLKVAAQSHLPSRFLLAQLSRRAGENEAARGLFEEICSDSRFQDQSHGLRSRTLRALAVLYRIQGSLKEAINYTAQEIELPLLNEADRARAQRRLERFKQMAQHAQEN